MASEATKSSLLALPLELRIDIYKHLLSPDPIRVYTLYHDRHGREASFDIDPTILRVNKQIYSEAVTILYDNTSVQICLATPVVRQCTGGNYPDSIVNPPNLFRPEHEEVLDSAKQTTRPTAASTVKGLGSKGGQLESTAPGYIYPHCFQRLRKIQLITSRPAIWAARRRGNYLSQTAYTVLRILKLLATAQVTQSAVTKYVKITLGSDWRVFRRQTFVKNAETEKGMRAMFRMLKVLERRKDVEIEVEEGVSMELLMGLEIEDTEVDEWEKMLLEADSDPDFSALLS